MAADPRVLPPWWRQPGALERVVGDLVADELAHLRPGGGATPPPPWPADLLLDEQGLGLDSLERLSVASALNEMLHLHESGVEDLLLVRRRFGEWVHLAGLGLDHTSLGLTFRTSGSRGAPKPCTHELVSLQQEVDFLAALFAGRQRLFSAVPAHHIYGFLFIVLLPTRWPDVVVHDVRRMTPQTLAARLAPGDLLVSHPAHWALMARHAGRLPPDVVGVSSTAPCPATVASELSERGLQRLVQVYGSSETAGIGWRDSPASPYRLMPHWSRPASEGSALQRLQPNGSHCEQVLQDRIDWCGDVQFHVAERRDQAVQVGGVNVFPERVRQVLLAHPLVQEATVRRMTPDEGERLKAFVVPRGAVDRQALPEALDRWVAQHLTAPERPRAFAVGDHLPVNALGKGIDWPCGPSEIHGPQDEGALGS
ncbi:4-coumarate--CoA ligase [Sphaerotilus sp.]|uniref:4-coumarate--CoA ligase n=1 Tax=Sphaerotilus sp. TaxID=2093942 RepID=UPI00286E9771|nr:4-coumarate--CoA ligase [Sphaerotilus sp.]